MNERINELAEQCRVNFICHECGESPFDHKKFAELIVKECSMTIRDFVDHRIPASDYPDKLKQHFGVEE